MKILITGIDGFIGRNLAQYLIENFEPHQILEIVGTYRNKKNLKEIKGVGQSNNLIKLQSEQTKVKLDFVQLDFTHNFNDFSLQRFDVVIHTAGLAHRYDEKNTSLYKKINTQATEKLLNKSIQAKVKQFIFLSTVKVYQENEKKVYDVFSKTEPNDEYGKSKLEAEKIIQTLAENSSDTSYAIIRLPLVYGISVKANFEKLWKMVEKTPVTPTGLIQSRRSMLGVLNLAHFIHFILLNSKAKNKIFQITDSQVYGFSQLLTKIAKVQNKKLIQIKIPSFVFKAIFKFFGLKKLNQRLFEDLMVVSNVNNKGDLKWEPVFSFEENFKKNKHQKTV